MAMIGTRVTHRTMFNNTMANMQSSLQRSQQLQEQLSSGKRITKPSDDATGTITAMQDRNEKRALVQQKRNADDGLGWLSTADGALQAASNTARAAYTKLIQAANDGTNGPTARNAIAQELAQLKQDLILQANTQYHGRPVFGGTDGSTEVFDVNGGLVGSTTGSVNRQITGTDTLAVNNDGHDIFSVGGKTVFAMIEDAITALNDPNTTARVNGVQTAIGEVQSAMTSMADGLSSIGARYRRIENVKTLAGDQELEMQSRIANVESIDLARTVMDVQMQDVAHRAALGATAKVLQPSLLDFLR